MVAFISIFDHICTVIVLWFTSTICLQCCLDRKLITTITRQLTNIKVVKKIVDTCSKRTLNKKFVCNLACTKSHLANMPQQRLFNGV